MLSWNRRFDDPWESAWGACHRLAWLNVCSLREALEALVGRHVAPSDLRAAIFTADGRWWSDTSLASSDDAQAAFASLRARFGRDGPVSRWQRVVAPLLEDGLRFCPRCLRTGFHSAVHQLAGLDRCPWHGVLLRSECGSCHRPFADVRQIGVMGLACQHCGVSAVPAAWPLHVSAATRSRRLAVEDQLTSWAQVALVNCPVPRDWGVEPIGVRNGRHLVPRSWAAVLLPIIASRTAFPLDKGLLCPEPAQLQRIGRPTVAPAGANMTWLDVDRAIAEATLEVTQYLGPHMRCYEGAGFMLSFTHVVEDTLPWEGDLCVKAWAYFVWRARCGYLRKDARALFRLHAPLGEVLSSDSLRQALVSSFHHGLQILVMSRSMLSRGVLPPERGMMSLADPWMSLMDPATARGFVYAPADSADVDDCDKGRVARRWEHPMAQLRRRQRENKKRCDQSDLGFFPALLIRGGWRGIGPRRWVRKSLP